MALTIQHGSVRRMQGYSICSINGSEAVGFEMGRVDFAIRNDHRMKLMEDV